MSGDRKNEQTDFAPLSAQVTETSDLVRDVLRTRRTQIHAYTVPG